MSKSFGKCHFRPPSWWIFLTWILDDPIFLHRKKRKNSKENPSVQNIPEPAAENKTQEFRTLRNRKGGETASQTTPEVARRGRLFFINVMEILMNVPRFDMFLIRQYPTFLISNVNFFLKQVINWLKSLSVTQSTSSVLTVRISLDIWISSLVISLELKTLFY